MNKVDVRRWKNNAIDIFKMLRIVGVNTEGKPNHYKWNQMKISVELEASNTISAE